ncbi:HAD-superfamily hydrolase, subfamily IA, variant 3 [Parvibaculum lavamentivorans DS-1]|uniref:HAD-superfamily hydrolase, subfamily IA, variant 3 n=1 Tax=Parvibaculum lavamentivorans (strain DS-1 / DSM 13023 / NCIMB 13966) TaxID=402881 RepID=A7HUQ7_PARL1|nr:HAD family phosphatase [Parvibaculum lavamentivorans]ABS63640.1 HAD-superfamily hydrolase, subfamily IA, variant 3 [Parvibaculum lavamentivorans DS-1]
MGEKLDTVVFDIGNVLIQWDPRHLYRSIFPDEAEMEAFLANVCTMEWHIEHDRGVPFADNALGLKARHPAHADLIDLWGARYLEMTPDRVPGTAALLRGLKAGGIALHGLTNMPSPVFPALCERYPELLLLEQTVVSGDEGILKPDPRIYRILIGRAGIDPSRTLFIDDSARNVETAASLGFHTHIFTGADGLEGALRGHGLI